MVCPFTKYGVTIQDHASFVFYERVHDLANRNDLSEPVVLGQIIAHDLGHLVLGEGAHADSGIMKEDLHVKDFRQAEKGRPLTFSTEQAQRMQARMFLSLGAKGELEVSVQVYNSARISMSDLIKAEAEAASMFQKAKIKVTWVESLMAREVKSHSVRDEALNPTPLQLRICTRGMVRPNVVATEKLGFVISLEQSHAVVLFDAVQNLAASRFTNPANLLGLAMAHEMGHLLLQAAAHSAAGVMRAQWLPRDLRDAEGSFMMFTREQDRLMRNEVVRRRIDMAHKR